MRLADGGDGRNEVIATVKTRGSAELLAQTSSRDKFVTNADGSVDLYLQANSPGKGKEANWLPAPNAKFAAMMRLYWPNETPPSIIDGSWKIPAVSKAP